MTRKSLVILTFFLISMKVSTSKSMTCSEIFPQTKSRLEAVYRNRNWVDDSYQRDIVDPFLRDYRTCDTCVFDLEEIIGNLRLTDLNFSGQILIAGDRRGSVLSRHIKNGDIYTLDLSNGHGDSRNVKGTVTHMPFSSGSFDFVLSHMVIHYLRARSEMGSHAQQEGYGLETNRQSEFISEVIRVLKVHGEARIGPVLYGEGKKLAAQFYGVTMHPNDSGHYFLVIRK